MVSDKQIIPMVSVSRELVHLAETVPYFYIFIPFVSQWNIMIVLFDY